MSIAESTGEELPAGMKIADLNAVLALI